MSNLGLFDNLVPYIVDTVIEASADDVVRAIQRSVRTLARDTEFFTEDYVLDIVAGQTEYVLDSIYSAKNLRVRTMTISDTVVTNAEYSLSISGRVVTLTNEPLESVTDGLEITTSLLPDLDCLELDEDQMERWVEAIIALAKYELHKQPRKPWSDPMEASMQINLYEGYVEIMAQDRIGQGQSGSSSVNLNARI
jgi:hypothetical protein